jgi:nucleoid DNA-binding protein
MATLTKAEIVSRVCQKNGLRRDHASKLVEATFETIKASLQRDERVTVIRIGKFTPFVKICGKVAI